MSNCRPFIILYFAFSLFCINASTNEPQDAHFIHYSYSEGLSHIGVSSAIQDSRGFLWVGTYDGLNRFDGQRFKVFHANYADSSSLINDRVFTIIESSDGLIWIGTEGGFCVYNPTSETFLTSASLGIPEINTRIIKLLEDSKHRIWVLTNRNIHIIDRNNDSFQTLHFNSPNTDIDYNIDIVECKDGYFYILERSRIITINSDLEIIPNNWRQIYPNTLLNDISYFSDSSCWIGLLNDVVQVKITQKGDSIRFSQTNIKINNIAASEIILDQFKNIWIGTRHSGIKKLIPNGNGFEIQTYRYNLLNPYSLSNDRIGCLYEDENGIIWIGTAENGLNKYNPSFMKFMNFGISLSDEYGLKTEYILSFSELENSNILIGTRHGGICEFDPDKKTYSKPDFNSEILRNRTISAILIDSRNNLWIGTWSGRLYRLIQGEKILEEVVNVQSSIYDLCEDDYGNLLVGSKSFITYISLNKNNQIENKRQLEIDFQDDGNNIIVSCLYNDPYDYAIWVGTWNDGLFRLESDKPMNEEENIAYQQYKNNGISNNSIYSNFATSVLRTSEEDIWVGTEGGGLIHGTILADSIRFENYNNQNGLSSNVVKSIIKDQKGQLWLGTNNGLNRFNPESKNFQVYNFSDGLVSSYFNKCALKLTDGNLIFGGNKGFTLFDPNEIQSSIFDLIPEIGSFQLSQQTVHPLEKINGRVLLSRSIMDTEVLNLRHNENTFSFELLALLNSEMSSEQFKYQLKGYDEDWVYSRKGEFYANYTNVPPGEYTFEVFVVYRDGSLSKDSRIINLNLSPPWWRTILAYIIYSIILLAAFIIILRINNRINRLKNRVEIDKIEQEKNKELTEAKVKFFMNVSHEFKTPITLIKGPLQYLIKIFQKDPEATEYLVTINRQADYLVNLLDQLVYFRKAESDTLKLKCFYTDIIPFIKKICDDYHWQSEEQRIDINFYHDVEQAFIWFDSQMMEKVIHNLLSNAFKYSNSGSSINVYLNETENHFRISVIDHGQGISKESLKHVFGRFYQADDSIGGYGIGLSLTKSLIDLHSGQINIQSEKSIGTTVEVLLKKGDQHLLEENKAVSKQPVISASEKPSEIQNNIRSSKKVNINSDSSKQKSKILIVEDNFRMLSFIEKILQTNYITVKAINGAEALKTIQHNIPDLIISDIMMPEMDGITLCQKLKSELLTCHIPIILLTAKSDIEDRIKGLKHGADLYIPKPFDIELLQVQVESMIQNREKIKERIRSKLPFDLVSDKNVHPLDADLLERIKIVLDENFHKSNFDSTQFSKKLHLNRSLFFTKMKAITNQTPSEYIKDFRIRKAVEYMIKEKTPVSEVNERVGIASRSHFGKCFKDVYGKSPSEFMKNRN